MVEGLERTIRQPTAPAKVRSVSLGDDEVGMGRHAKVRSPVADDHTPPHARSRPVGALAIGSSDPTVATGMGERKPPPIAPAPLQPICEKWDRKPFALQDGAHKAIEAVRDDDHDHALAGTEMQESTEPRVNPDIANFLVELFGCRAQERYLAPHTLARGNPSSLPRVFDIAPSRIGKPLKEAVGWIVGRNGAIEVDENTTFHVSTRGPHKVHWGMM